MYLLECKTRPQAGGTPPSVTNKWLPLLPLFVFKSKNVNNNKFNIVVVQYFVCFFLDSATVSLFVRLGWLVYVLFGRDSSFGLLAIVTPPFQIQNTIEVMIPS